MLQAFHYWPDFCEHIGRPDLVGDPRFDTNENLMKHTAEAIAEIVPVMASRTFAEWTEAFQTLKGSGRRSRTPSTFQTIRRSSPTAT